MVDPDPQPSPQEQYEARLAQSAQATHMSIMAWAASEDRLERVRKDRSSTAEQISDAARNFRQSEKSVFDQVAREKDLHKMMLQDLTNALEQRKIQIVVTKQEGAHDAQNDPSGG